MYSNEYDNTNSCAMPVLLTGCGFIMKLFYLLGLGAYECDIAWVGINKVLFNNEYIIF